MDESIDWFYSQEQEVASKKQRIRQPLCVINDTRLLLATGNQLLLRKLGIFCVCLFFGILSKPNKFSVVKRIECTIKINHWIVIASFRWSEQFLLLFLAWHKPNKKTQFKEGSFYCYFGSTLLLLLVTKKKGGIHTQRVSGF